MSFAYYNDYNYDETSIENTHIKEELQLEERNNSDYVKNSIKKLFLKLELFSKEESCCEYDGTNLKIHIFKKNQKKLILTMMMLIQKTKIK